jgi:hypothetical protein
MSAGRICPCGATLLTRAECLASDDELLRHVGEAYLGDEDGFCVEEDDVVPLAWSFGTEAERQQRMRPSEGF